LAGTGKKGRFAFKKSKVCGKKRLGSKRFKRLKKEFCRLELKCGGKRERQQGGEKGKKE